MHRLRSAERKLIAACESPEEQLLHCELLPWLCRAEKSRQAPLPAPFNPGERRRDVSSRKFCCQSSCSTRGGHVRILLLVVPWHCILLTCCMRSRWRHLCPLLEDNLLSCSGILGMRLRLGCCSGSESLGRVLALGCTDAGLVVCPTGLDS